MMKIEPIKWLTRAIACTLLSCAVLPSLHAQTSPGQSARLQAMKTKIAATRKSHTPALQPQVLVQPTAVPKINTVETYYTFTGSGSWLTAANWQGTHMPPSILKAGDHVVIEPKKTCLFNNKGQFLLVAGSSLEVKPGATLYVTMGSHFALRGGTLVNNGSVKVMSGKARLQNALTGSGTVHVTRMSSLSPKRS